MRFCLQRANCSQACDFMQDIKDYLDNDPEVGDIIESIGNSLICSMMWYLSCKVTGHQFADFGCFSEIIASFRTILLDESKVEEIVINRLVWNLEIYNSQESHFGLSSTERKRYFLL